MQWDATLYQKSHGFVADYGKALLEFVPVNFGQRILDVGCGTGELTAELAKRCAHVTGIDSSPVMIEAAKARFPKLDFAVMDALELSFPEPFNVVFSNAVFHWIIDQKALLYNIRGVLKTGGLLVCEFGAKGNIGRIERAFAQAASELGEAYASPFYFPASDEYGALLRTLGFKIEHIVEFDRPTKLTGGKEGLRNWLMQFFAGDLRHFSNLEREALLASVQEKLKEALWDAEHWVADYRRLQVVARKD